MLVLSRQRDETIMIGDNIEITIVDIRGDKVRLGITAPATIPVHRKEVYDAIQRENREAARMKMEDLGNLPKAGRPSVPPGLHRPATPIPGPTTPGSVTATPPNPPAPPAPPAGSGGTPIAAAPIRIPSARPGDLTVRVPTNGTGHGAIRSGPPNGQSIASLGAVMNNGTGSMTTR